MSRRTVMWVAALSAIVGFSHVPAAAQDLVYRIPVTGVVELGLAPFIERGLEEAAAAGAAFVLLDMDTPGGRVDAVMMRLVGRREH